MTLGDVLKAWTNVNAKAVGGRVELRADTSRPFTSDCCPAHLQPVRERVRDALIERLEDCLAHPNTDPKRTIGDVLGYLRHEKSGDWTSWKDWKDEGGE